MEKKTTVIDCPYFFVSNEDERIKAVRNIGGFKDIGLSFPYYLGSERGNIFIQKSAPATEYVDKKENTIYKYQLKSYDQNSI